jgi:hypothetical protein
MTADNACHVWMTLEYRPQGTDSNGTVLDSLRKPTGDRAREVLDHIMD